MSGHSKWAQIKRSKGAADQKRGLLFSKLSKKISIAVKEGGGSGDISINYKLKSAVEYAKEQGMPNGNIDRAIRAASGAGTAAISEATYEGYGPFGTAFLVETATDNTNRTFQNIRHIFTKHSGNIGAKNSVAWQFETKGQILVERTADTQTATDYADKNRKAISDLSKFQLIAIDAGAVDVRESEVGLEVYTKAQDLQKVKTALKMAGAKIAGADIIKESNQGVNLTEEQKPKVEALFAELENDEDVISVHTSANF